MECATKPGSQTHVTAAEPFFICRIFSLGSNRRLIIRLCSDAFGFMDGVISSGRMVE